MTYICKPYVFKIVLSLSLLNFLRFLKNREKNVKLILFPISQKKIKNIFQFLPQILGISLVRGPRRWPKWPRPRASPEYDHV